MSRRDEGPKLFVADTDLFFFYLRGGPLEEQAADIIEKAAADKVVIRASSEVYDDAISAIRSEGQPLSVAEEFVSAMRSIPHSSIAMTSQIATDAVALYKEFGGRGRLSYFDSFHVATAKSTGLEFLTSDGYIIRNASKLGVRAYDLAHWMSSARGR